MDRGFIYLNKKNLISNLDYLRQVSQKKICLVVKANAYGHGIEWTVRVADSFGVDWFAVASVDEALIVRKASPLSNILLLSEPSVSQLDIIQKNKIDLTVYNTTFIDELIKSEYPFNVHLKVDTGMHRVGCEPDKFETLFSQIVESSLNLRGVCTHFPVSDTNSESTNNSIALFKEIISNVDVSNLLVHVDNSASTFFNSDTAFNMSRIGLAAYGTFVSSENLNHELNPIMEIKTRISNLQKRKAGETVSYGKAQKLERDSIIATAPIGYGDGYPWNSFPDGRVIVKNTFCKLVGRVTMDQILFDVTDLNVEIDDEVVILGKSDDSSLEITVSDIASWNKTIEWEILTNMSKRLERVEVG